MISHNLSNIDKVRFNNKIKTFLDFRNIENNSVDEIFKVISKDLVGRISKTTRNNPKILFIYLLYEIYRKLFYLKKDRYYFQKDISELYQDYIGKYNRYFISYFKKSHPYLVDFIESIKIE